MENTVHGRRDDHYSVDLGAGAITRGGRVICQGLGWAGTNRSLVNVRVVHSIVPSYRVGARAHPPRLPPQRHGAALEG